ncbi:MAG: cytochrome c biogenesis protein CcsA [Planctomycetia bacterium]|nr:cytochrome c biogenesis protein CcsA [Planctomycetia bacterium]
MPLDGISRFCFGASYAVALLLELLQVMRPRAAQRVIGIAFGCAGLFAHSIYLLVQRPPLTSQIGSLLFLTWILAVFYLYGALHHRELTWGLFVLPVVVGLVVLTELFPPDKSDWGAWLLPLDELRGYRFWGQVHAAMLLFAAVGCCIGFVASIMYLVQARRLRAKTLPGEGPRLWSLERLEQMNRRAVNLTFPLLTIGALIGVALMLQRPEELQGWTDPRILGTVALWSVLALLLYLRYAGQLAGRRLAQLTIVAFVLLVFTLVYAHSLSSAGGAP